MMTATMDVDGPSPSAGDGATALPWVEKYRPATLEQIACHEGAIGTIRKFIDEHRVPHLFFYGPPGTGKTSTANAIARALHGPRWRSNGSVLELNASDERGIDAVREQIKTFCSAGVFTAPSEQAPKLVILDEADAMTSAAQNALRRIIEKYVQRVRFIIIGNYAGQIIPALQSRCTKFRFVPLDRTSMMLRLQWVVEQEHLSISDAACNALVDLSEGDMRKVLNWLQAAHSSRHGRLYRDDHNGKELCDEEGIVAEDIFAVAAAADPRSLSQVWQSATATAMEGFSLVDVVGRVRAMQLSLGFSNGDLVKHFARELLANATALKPAALTYGLYELAQCEQRLALGCGDDIQLASILSTAYTVSRLQT